MDSQLATREIDLKRRHVDDLRGVPAVAAHQRLQARGHFFNMKRFGDVVVGARFQRFDFGLPAFARGEHQNRLPHRLAAPAADQRHAVFIRQAQIDQRDIGQMLL